jgi:hypothetical protein
MQNLCKGGALNFPPEEDWEIPEEQPIIIDITAGLPSKPPPYESLEVEDSLDDLFTRYKLEHPSYTNPSPYEMEERRRRIHLALGFIILMLGVLFLSFPIFLFLGGLPFWIQEIKLELGLMMGLVGVVVTIVGFGKMVSNQ